MKNLRNKVQLIGNVGNTPEVKEIAGGKKVAKFSIATNESYKNQKGEKITDTQWHNLIVWGNQANAIEKYVQKGAELAIEGKLQSSSYIDKEGIKRYVTEIVVSDFLLMSKKEK